MDREAGLLVAVWGLLLLLLSLTVAAAIAPLGGLKPVINLAIAGCKAGLIAWFYMHLREQPGLNRVMALGALAWLSIILAMTLADIATRQLA